MSAAAAATQPAEEPAPATRELIIERCLPMKSGPRKDGKGQWTIYDVHAKTPDGQLVAQRLRAWDLLPLGLPARTYEIQRDVFRRDDGAEVVSYFLRLPKPSMSELRLMLDEVYAHLAGLEQQLLQLDRRVAAIEAPEPAPSQPQLSDEDIPF